MTKDLTKGSVTKNLIFFTLPMFVSVAFQQMYNLADSIIAGKFAGKQALAAVGASYPVTMLFIAIALGAGIGVSVVISQFFGRKDMGKLKTAVSTSLISVFILSVILTAIGVIFSTPILKMLSTGSDIFEASKLYLDIYIWGLVFLFIYNISTGIFTAMGDSKTPLLLLIASSVLNIILDMVFVIALKMDVAGVAWATFIAQGAASILAFILLLYRIKKMNITEISKRFSFTIFKSICFIAVPSIIQQSFVSVGQLFIQGLINSLGTDVIAGYSAAIKLNVFVITSLNTIANGVSTFSAQNIGAGKIDRVKKGFKTGVMLNSGVGAVFSLIYCFLSQQMIGMFLNLSETGAVATGEWFLWIISPFYAAVAVKLVCDGILRGAGYVKAFMISTFSDLIIRVVLSYILVNFMGEYGIWTAWVVGWLVSTVIALSFYLSKKWVKAMHS